MVELISGPLPDYVAQKDLPAEATPGEVQGASIENTFNALPLVAESRSNLARYGTTFIDPDAPPGELDRLNGIRDTPRTITSADDMNEQAKAAGVRDITPFTHDVDTDVGQQVIQDHLTAQRNNDIIARNGNSILSGGLARFATGALVSLADPINDMAMMIPVAPEAWVAGRIAAAGGAVGRFGMRAAVGGAQGALGMAALEPLQYGQDVEDHTAWSIGDAMQRIAFGAALGAGGHALLGGLFGERVAAMDPATRDGALRVATSDVMSDRRIQVSDLIDHGEASQAADRLERWQLEQERILADASRVRTETTVGEPPNRAGDIADNEATLAQLHAQAGSLRGEIEGLRAKAVTGGMDAETLARLDQVQHELGQVIPKTRRAALGQELTMLTEGRGDFDVSASDLEGARTQAQIQGTQAALTRTTAIAAKTETELAAMVAHDANLQRIAQESRVSADRTARIAQAGIDSREATLQNLMEREVRRFAAKVQVPLEPGEAATVAREIRTAQPGEVTDTIAAHLNAISKRSDQFPVRDAVDAAQGPVPSTTGTLRQEAAGAARDFATKRMNPTADPDIAAAEKVNNAVLSRAPKFDEIDATKDVTEAEKMVSDRKADYDNIMKYTDREDTAELKNALEAADNTEKTAKAGADYASCLAARGG